jgi:hypothetical protein
MKKIVPLLAILLLLPMARVARAAEPTGDSPDQLKQLFDSGKYAELLPKLNKALAAKGPAAAQYQKYDLWNMKGESLLRMHSSSPAAQAFTEAAATADKPEDAAIATATAALIKQSSGLKYMPQARADKSTSRPAPIDIVDPESRKAAFAAFSADLLAKAKPRVDAAAHAQTLPQVIHAVQGLGDLRPVEVAATGSDTQSKQMLGDLATKASQLINGSLDQMSARVTAIGEQAKQKPGAAAENPLGGNTKTNGQPYQAPAPGLTMANAGELRRIINNATQLGIAAKSMTATFGEAGDFKDAVSKAETIITDAHKVLQDNGKEPKPRGE